MGLVSLPSIRSASQAKLLSPPSHYPQGKDLPTLSRHPWGPCSQGYVWKSRAFLTPSLDNRRRGGDRKREGVNSPTLLKFLSWGEGEANRAGSWASPSMPPYLSPQVLDGLKVMSPVSDLGSLLLQVFPDFAFQSPIISLQAPHPLQVRGQAVIQGLHSLLLSLDAPYAR